jgi:hypothetical protein
MHKISDKFCLLYFTLFFEIDFVFHFNMHTELLFCYMLHAQNLSYIHILYTQKGVYILFEYKKNFELEAFRFSMVFKIFRQIKHFD